MKKSLHVNPLPIVKQKKIDIGQYKVLTNPNPMLLETGLEKKIDI